MRKPNTCPLCRGAEWIERNARTVRCIECNPPKAKRQKISDAKYRAAAKAQYDDEGTIEIDDAAPVSWGDDGGAYVQAWVWVYDTDAKPMKRTRGAT